jgi:hypothetical protein
LIRHYQPPPEHENHHRTHPLKTPRLWRNTPHRLDTQIEILRSEMKEFHSSPEKFQKDIESACTWLESLNIGINKNRVAEYRKTFAAIIEHLNKGTINELEKSIDFAKQADNFHDASELILIHQHLEDYACPVFLKTLAKAVNGPTSLAAERSVSSDARNKVFELVTAALFHNAGFRPKFLEPADAIVTVEGIKCSVECKRIQAENGLEACIEKASSQIKKRLSQERSTIPRGLIAVDISKAVNIGGSLYFSAPSSEELTKQVDLKLSAFLKPNLAKLRKGLHPRIFAVLVYLRTPAVIEDAGGLLANFRRLYVVESRWNDGKNKIAYEKVRDGFAGLFAASLPRNKAHTRTAREGRSPQ